MDIILRRRAGNQYIAKLKNERKFARPSTSREGAIGNLVEKHWDLFRITTIQWDLKDPWTKNCIDGNPRKNRTYHPCGVNVRNLPEVSSKIEAKLLKFGRLPIPWSLKNVIEWLPFPGIPPEYRVNIPLGHLCTFSASELMALSHKYYRIGDKKIGYLREILGHYGLKLRGD